MIRILCIVLLISFSLAEDRMLPVNINDMWRDITDFLQFHQAKLEKIDKGIGLFESITAGLGWSWPEDKVPSIAQMTLEIQNDLKGALTHPKVYQFKGMLENAFPIIVEKHSGSLTVSGTASSHQSYEGIIKIRTESYQSSILMYYHGDAKTLDIKLNFALAEKVYNVEAKDLDTAGWFSISRNEWNTVPLAPQIVALCFVGSGADATVKLHLVYMNTDTALDGEYWIRSAMDNRGFLGEWIKTFNIPNQKPDLWSVYYLIVDTAVQEKARWKLTLVDAAKSYYHIESVARPGFYLASYTWETAEVPKPEAKYHHWVASIDKEYHLEKNLFKANQFLWEIKARPNGYFTIRSPFNNAGLDWKLCNPWSVFTSPYDVCAWGWKAKLSQLEDVTGKPEDYISRSDYYLEPYKFASDIVDLDDVV